MLKMTLLPQAYFLEDRLSEGPGHHPQLFWQGGSSMEKAVVVPKGCQSMGFAEKTLQREVWKKTEN